MDIGSRLEALPQAVVEEICTAFGHSVDKDMGFKEWCRWIEDLALTNHNLRTILRNAYLEMCLESLKLGSGDLLRTFNLALFTTEDTSARRQIYEAAVRENGVSLGYVPLEDRDQSLCYIAVNANPHALRWVPPDVEWYHSICLAAAILDRESLVHCERLQYSITEQGWTMDDDVHCMGSNGLGVLQNRLEWDQAIRDPEHGQSLDQILKLHTRGW